MKLPSASRLALALQCLGAAVLTRVERPSTTAQENGTGKHVFIERARAVGREAALAEIPDDAAWKPTCVALDLDAIPVGRHEIALAYDCATDTARCLGSGLAREYGATMATEVTGTADLIVPPTADHPRWRVIDFKGRERVDGAAVNVQLGFYALCVARVERLDEIDVELAYIDEDGSVEWDRATLGPFEIEALAARVRELQARVAEADAALDRGRLPELVTGPHCLRCHAFELCPAQVQVARTMVEMALEGRSPADLARSLGVLSDEDAGISLERMQRAAALLDAGITAIRERARLRPLPLPDGSSLVSQERTRRTVDVERALDALRPMFGDQADGLVERSLSIENLRALARQVAPGVGQKKAADELLASLEAVGAVKTSRFVVLTVRKPRGTEAQS